MHIIGLGIVKYFNGTWFNTFLGTFSTILIYRNIKT